jgi:hypothetical protein
MEDLINSLKRREMRKLYDQQSLEIMLTAEDAFERGVNPLYRK